SGPALLVSAAVVEPSRFADSLTSEPSCTVMSRLQSFRPLVETRIECFPAGNLSVAGQLPTNEPSTYKSAPSGSEVTAIVPGTPAALGAGGSVACWVDWGS